MAALAGAALLVWSAPSRAELNRADRAAVLYSTQLAFDSNNVPIVNIAVMEGQETIRVSATEGLVIQPDDKSGTSIDIPTAKKVFTAHVESGKPSRLRYTVVVDRLKASNVERVRETQKRWQERDFKIRLIELGSVFGFYGRVQDSRVALVCIDHAYDDLDEAREAAETLGASYEDANVSLHEEVAERSSGTVILTDGAITVRNQDVIWLAPRGKGMMRVEDVEFGIGFPWHGREGRAYAGRIALAVDRRGKLLAINQVDAETLLKGLVPAEIYPSSPPAALEAQAVTARGELLAKIGLRHLADPYLVCSDQHCQVYRGVGHEDPRTSAAVDATKGRMLYRGSELVDAVYSASCGGHTENNEDVWGNAPKAALRGRPDAPSGGAYGVVTEANVREFIEKPPAAYCGSASKGTASYRWSKKLSADEVTALVRKKHPEVGRVLDIRVVERGVSGRARLLEIKGDGGVARVERELPIRQLLGSLKSALFVVDRVDGSDGRAASFELHGGGFGHGVGMCQVGAIGMSEKGATFEQILKHYYDGSEVLTIY